MSEFWKTSISQVLPGEILIRGYRIEELIRKRTFGDVVYLLLTGELPKGKEGKLVEAILVACCEHSLAAPSTDAVRFVASCGVPLQTAVAAGVSAIGDIHGGAIEPCALLLQQAIMQGKFPSQVFLELKAEGRRLSGFGHPVHREDPRALALISLADDWSLSGAHTSFARELEASSLELIGRKLNMNVDGAIAALMCDIGIDPSLGKAFFIIGRSPGYVAHAHEQVTQEPAFKAASYSEITYLGPAQRDLPEK